MVAVGGVGGAGGVVGAAVKHCPLTRLELTTVDATLLMSFLALLTTGSTIFDLFDFMCPSMNVLSVSMSPVSR